MEYTIVEMESASAVSQRVNELIEKGWKPVGSHQVTTKYMQNRYSGTQLQSATYALVHSQTMIKE